MTIRYKRPDRTSDKPLDMMTAKELGLLFPIYLAVPDPAWPLTKRARREVF